MRITVKYMAQLRQATGVASEEIEVSTAQTVQDTVRIIAERRGDAVRRILLDANGRMQPSLLVFVGDQQVPADWTQALTDKDILTLLTPMAGG